MLSLLQKKKLKYLIPANFLFNPKRIFFCISNLSYPVAKKTKNK
jgi:hypothetical protein